MQPGAPLLNFEKCLVCDSYSIFAIVQSASFRALPRNQDFSYVGTLCAPFDFVDCVVDSSDELIKVDKGRDVE